MNDTGTTIVADLEAGIGTLTRLDEAAVDVTVVVVEPTPRSIDVAQRAVAVANERHQGRLVIVANKVLDQADRNRIVEAFPDHQHDRDPGGSIVFIPDDPAITEADRLGISPVDHSPDSPAVRAVEGLVDLLDLGAKYN